MLTVLLLAVAVVSEIQLQPPLQNGNSLLSGRMSSQLIKQLADVAYSLMKNDRKGHLRRKKKPKYSFKDYDDAVGGRKDLAVLAPAPMTMLNGARSSQRNVQNKALSRRPLATFNHPIHQPNYRRPLPLADSYVMPPVARSPPKGSRWTVVARRRYRTHHGRARRQPVQ